MSCRVATLIEVKIEAGIATIRAKKKCHSWLQPRRQIWLDRKLICKGGNFGYKRG